MAYIGKQPAVAALTASDITDGIVSNVKLAQDIISADTELAVAPASTDELLISDAGVLKRIDYSLIKAVNTPAFHAYISSDQSIDDSTQTLLDYDTEAFDTAGAYDASTNRFTPQTAGKYVVYAQMTPNNVADHDVFEIQLYKNEVTSAGAQAMCRGRNEAHETKYVNRIVEFNGSSDFVYVYTYQTAGSAKTVRGTKYDSFFGAYKIIE